MDWRVAAALTMITVGGLSVAVSDRIGDRNRDVSRVLPESIVTKDTNQPPGTTTPSPVASPNPLDSGNGTPQGRTPAQVREVKVQLSVGGGVNDLDDASLRALLGALDEIDRAPVAPSTEPDRASVLPVIRESDR
jgi:hypothetical protein